MYRVWRRRRWKNCARSLRKNSCSFVFAEWLCCRQSSCRDERGILKRLPPEQERDGYFPEIDIANALCYDRKVSSLKSPRERSRVIMTISKRSLFAVLFQYLFIYLFSGLLFYYFWRTSDWKLILLRPLAVVVIYAVYCLFRRKKNSKTETGELNE